MQPRGLPLLLRRARELVEGLQSTQTTHAAPAAAHAPQPFRPPPWLRPQWEQSDEQPLPWRPPPRRAAPRGPIEPPAQPHPAPHRHTTPPQPQVQPQAQPSSQPQAQSQSQPSQSQAQPIAIPEGEAGRRMRDILRNVAQPVVIAVTASGESFHGATLTSFASLTLEPHPLVAFSLRLPSRLADCLRPPPPEPQAGDCAPGNMCSPPAQPTRLTISLLSHANQGAADALAKPGHQGTWEGWDRMGGIPIVAGGVGGLLCQVVHTVPLRDVGGDTTSANPGSELFVCRVLDATKGTGGDSLVHYQREYGCVRGSE